MTPTSPVSFSSVLVANRGEIALRIMRTLRRLGVESVAVYTDADRDAPHVSSADRAVHLPGPLGYLDVEAVLDAARRSGAAAVHPGYGFLSENPVLARACAAAGVAFIGPPAEAIELMGDKINAKRAVAAAGVPVVPGRDEPGLDDQALARAAVEIGLPVLLKPSAGGGGKGMRRVDDPADLPGEIAAARREAKGAFGDDTLLVERYITAPRHIEVQVFADASGTTVALGERECSLQRRHQKIVEEAPSPLLDDRMRARMAEQAVATARACGYVGAGTVEFIVSADRPEDFWFMEMNTRLQVEHPVTEMVFGVDLVEWQLRVAAGEPLPCDPSRPLQPTGHAVEARVYAEDPSRGFLPSSGPVLALGLPEQGDGIRVDTALRAGGRVGTRYDPMIAKVVAWGEHRAVALARLREALGATEVLGLATNTGFLRRLLACPDVVSGNLDTGLVERVAPDIAPCPPDDHVLVAAALLESGPATPDVAAHRAGPWEQLDGWRMGEHAPRATEWGAAGRSGPVEVRTGPGWAEVGSGGRVPAVLWANGDGTVTAEVDGSAVRYRWAREGDRFWLGSGGDSWSLDLVRESVDGHGGAATGDGTVSSPMPGTVLAVHVAPGATVAAGQPLVSVEAMKMEHVVAAPFDGRVAAVEVRAGQSVRLDEVLARVERGEEA
ncbi:MAG TPA: biotin carboxylase N-terminal domain-containing protein [Acidimicrobiales bacterium]|nr:biotin carboxylase N-terminal domain-containing protein [Acidimicrobiales bacterium]